jgi:hypothetical protein
MTAMHQETHGEKRAELGTSFYRMFNRFICEYLEHIDAEEQNLPYLWEAYTDEQLMLCMLTYKASIGSDEALLHVVSHFPAQEKATQQRLFQGFKNNATSQDFQLFCDRLKSTLTVQEYNALNAHSV